MHIRRRDPWINFTTAIIRSLSWFHPLTHLAIRYFRVDQEFACDAAVLDMHTQDRRHYAYAMLKGQLGGPVLPAGCRLDSHAATALRRRILMLQTSPPSRRRRALGATAITISVIAGGGLACAAPLPQSAVSPVSDTTNQPVQPLTVPGLEYPGVFASTNTPGIVELQYIVDTAGHVEPNSFKVLAQTHDDFTVAAKEALLKGTFKPAQVQGRPIRQLVQQSISFMVGNDLAVAKPVGLTNGATRIDGLVMTIGRR
jgi:hypothetical protein